MSQSYVSSARVTLILTDPLDLSKFCQSSHQEMRLSSDTEGGLKWQAGAFYYNARQTAPFSITIDNVLIDLISYTTHTRSLAGFGQVDIPLSDALSVSAGARYTEDKRRFDPLDCSQSRTGTVCNPTLIDRIAEGRWTYRLGVDFKPMDDVMLYASYSRGFKSGGWNTARVANLRGPVGSEQIDNFELGFKGSLANGSVSLNAALFHYKYKGMQALIGANDPITGTTQTLYINAGDPRAYGAEAELSARPIDNLELRMGAGWLDTKVRADPNFTADGRSLNGNRLQQAPTFSGNLVIRYTIPLGTGGGISLQADGRYQTKVFVGIDNDPSEMIAAYAVANIRVGWKSDGGQYSLEAFADNVFDKHYFQHIYHQTLASFPATVTGSSPLFDSSYAVWGRPRTWGIRAGYSF
ncbi:MAG: TonB-dependent receptor [Verrucomicrobiaceae bacterium]|nr:MAG: TonB-dependent receptor [Verrucomicrobiaceae bacterium]